MYTARRCSRYQDHYILEQCTLGERDLPPVLLYSVRTYSEFQERVNRSKNTSCQPFDALSARGSAFLDALKDACLQPNQWTRGSGPGQAAAHLESQSGCGSLWGLTARYQIFLDTTSSHHISGMRSNTTTAHRLQLDIQLRNILSIGVDAQVFRLAKPTRQD